MIWIILSILWFLGVLYWDVHSDFRKWIHNEPVDHTKEAFIRGLLLIPSVLGFSQPDFNILNMLMAMAMIGSWWWEFFDGWYNTKRRLPWRYNGSIDPDDSRLDTFLYHLNETKQALLKWGLIILFTTLYIIT